MLLFYSLRRLTVAGRTTCLAASACFCHVLSLLAVCQPCTPDVICYLPHNSVLATETELGEATGQREELYAKQSRGSKYRTAEERDAALKSKVKSTRLAAKGKSDTAASLKSQAVKMSEQLDRQRKKAAEMEAQLQERHLQSQRVSADLAQRTTARNSLAEERKEKWRVIEGLQVTVLLLLLL